MKFEISQETAIGSYTWKLVTNNGSPIAAGAIYTTVAETTQAITAFKTWVGSAPIEGLK